MSPAASTMTPLPMELPAESSAAGIPTGLAVGAAGAELDGAGELLTPCASIMTRAGATAW